MRIRHGTTIADPKLFLFQPGETLNVQLDAEYAFPFKLGVRKPRRAAFLTATACGQQVSSTAPASTAWKPGDVAKPMFARKTAAASGGSSSTA